MVDKISSNIVQVRGAVAPSSSSSLLSSSCVSNRLSESSSNINSNIHSSLIEESKAKANATSPIPNESPFSFTSASSLVSPTPESGSGNNKPSVVVLVALAPAPPSSSSSPSSAVARVVTLESLSPDDPAGNSNPNRDRVVPFADPSVLEFSAPESTFQRESSLAVGEEGVPQVEDDDEDDDALFETLSSHYLSDENHPLLASLDLPLGIGFADQVDRISDSNSNSSASSSPAPEVEDRSYEKRNSPNSTPDTTALKFRQVKNTTNYKKYPVESNHSQRQRKKPAKAHSNSTIIASNIMSDSHPSAMRPTLVPTPLLPSPESSPAPAPVAAVPPIAPVGAATTPAATAPTTPSQNPAPAGSLAVPATAAPTTGPAPSTAYPLPHRPLPAAAKPPASSQPPSQPQGHSRPPAPPTQAPSAANTTQSQSLAQTTSPAPPPATTHPSYHPSSHLHYPPHPRPVTAGLPPISIPGNAPAAASTPRAAPSVKPASHHHHHGEADSPDSRSAVAENTGRWTAEEHRLFLQGLEQHGKGWKKIAGLIKSRTVVQIRTHAQKYFQKLAKARQNGEGPAGGLVVGGEPSPHGAGERGGVSVMHGATAAMTLTTSTMGGGGVPAAATTHGYGLSTAAVDGNISRGATTGAAMLPSSSTSAQATAARPRAGGNAGNMAMGTDPTSLAVAAAGLAAIQGTSAATPASGAASTSQAPGKRRRGPPTGTKRRVIGSVVRSAVREGRNVKRQKIAEARRNGGGEAAEGAVNPLPAISNILDPYVAGAVAAQAQTSATGRGGGGGKNGKNAKGRNQLVQTATHGTLPMASLEDAVFRLLTPATGAPAPQLPTGPAAAPSSIVDPLAPNPVRPHSMTHANYGVNNSSPTCVADISTYPAWVDANNPPQWYNDGSDIDKLLEEADCLNWLDDTGDFDENYVPPPSDMDFNIDPTSVTSHSHESQHNAAVPTPEDDRCANMPLTYAETPSLLSADGTATEPQPTAVKMEEDVATEPTMIHAGGVVHPSGESLSFLVDEETEANHLPLQGFVDHAQDALGDHPPATFTVPYSSATEAVEAHDRDGKFHRDESHGGLMSFPDLGMGDEQAFVSALLEDNGQNSTISFPKFHSDLGVHLSQGQSGIGLSASSEAPVKEEMP